MKRITWFSKSLTILLLLMSVISCNKKMTSDEILEERGSGVVLILNRFYYKVTLPNGKAWYFTGFDSDGNMENFTTEQSEIEQKASLETGTGFFISEDGKILTNRHVASPDVNLKDAKHSVKSLLASLQQLIIVEASNLSDQYDELENEKSSCQTYDDYGNEYTDYDKLQEIADQQQELKDKFADDKKTYDEIQEIDVSEISLETVVDLSIAYNDTYVTKFSDFKPCVKIAVSDKENVDLAIIQLKDKQTPTHAYVFTIDYDSDSPKELNTEDKLYMIGYNAGFKLSNTKQGIKAQITSGAISQKPDDDKIMYTIPALPGSSGSPVVNQYGELVAVNFAGVSSTQNFNFGIQLKRVKQFIDYN